MRPIVALIAGAAALLGQGSQTAEEFQTNADAVRIAPIQHASTLIQAGGDTLYLDPAQGSYDGLPKADLILITDIHGDHMNPKVLAAVRKPGTVIIAPEAVAQTVTDATVLRNGESKTIGKWRIEAVPAYNLQRGPEPGKLFHDKGRGNGYVLSYGGKRFYFSGYTEGVPEMRALKNIDVAFVCMNLPYTMPPQEAAEAVKAFRPKVVYPYHYRNSDLSVFEKALTGSGVDVRLRDWY
jgi:L-ascorbate metabolism protein UlaG (beta-lactamase superfamily)